MTDNLSKEKRSKIMASIRSRNNNTTELRMRSLLRKAGIVGWRRHLKLSGRPDFAWPKKKIALFIDGCFWHGCKKCYKPPRTNAEFWAQKIENNKKRDKRNNRDLKKAGWSVLRISECDLLDQQKSKERIRLLLSMLNKPTH